MKEILDYIEDLKQNNNREWFQSTKPRYEKARADFSSMIQEIIDKLQFTDQRLIGLNAKDTMFRIYRDIRFSKDKTPYKTHFGAYISPGGRKSSEAGYYIHISREELFAGAGVYQPEKENLKAIRQEIFFQPEEYLSLLEQMKGLGYEQYENDKLKTGPKDFPKDFQYLDLLNYRHYFISKNFSVDEALEANFKELVFNHLTNMIPFALFLNNAMDYKGNE